MMSVVIKWMDMPKSCAECRFEEGGWCFGMRKTNRQPIIFPNIVASWCPLSDEDEQEENEDETD